MWVYVLGLLVSAGFGPAQQFLVSSEGCTITGQSSLAAGQGLFHALWAEKQGGTWSLFYAHNPDGGASWQGHETLAQGLEGAPAGLIKVQGGALAALWTYSGAGGGVYVSRSQDGGAHWSSPERIETSRPQGDGFDATLNEGVIHAAWVQAALGDDEVICGTRVGFGWELVRLTSYSKSPYSQPHMPRVAASMGLVLGVWAEKGATGKSLLQSSSSDDGGLSFTTPAPVFAEPVRLNGTALIADSGEFLLFTATDQGLNYVIRSGKGPWGRSNTLARGDVSRLSAARDAEGLIHIAWEDGAGLHYSHTISKRSVWDPVPLSGGDMGIATVTYTWSQPALVYTGPTGALTLTSGATGQSLLLFDDPPTYIYLLRSGEDKFPGGSLLNSLKLHPNPSDGLFTVSAGAPLQGRLYRLDGVPARALLSPFSKGVRVDCSGLAAGVYILRVTDGTAWASTPVTLR